ncbi:MAG: hypothetical protein RBS57_11655 [Desulforhabdus sp.]|nr:hypothetical protein [Desulforhabdus sp.]
MQELEKDPLVVEFQRRRTNMLQAFIFAILLIALALAIKQLSDQYQDFLGINQATWSAIAVAQLITGGVIALRGFLQYRCPVCNKIVRAHDKYYLGVAVNPTHCPKCGRRLS